MNLRANPFIGQYTNEELQEWIKALQDECVRMAVMNDIVEKVEANNERIIKSQIEIIAELKVGLKLREEQTKMLWSAIEKLEREPINRTTLVAFSAN